MLSDPEIGDNFIQPLKSQGVIEMQDSAMIIRVKFMTKPGDQWTIRKKVFQEIRDLFDREGIKFAHREVTVRLAEDQADNMTPKQKDAAIGAVQAAIDEDLLDANEPAGGDDR
jgi:small-conductance mechanosensitive channel